MRPWSPWKPYVERKWGKLEEHPMPDTMRTSFGSSWSRARACWVAFSTAKSPHPGHHVGFTSDL